MKNQNNKMEKYIVEQIHPNEVVVFLYNDIFPTEMDLVEVTSRNEAFGKYNIIGEIVDGETSIFGDEDDEYDLSSDGFYDDFDEDDDA